MTAKPSKRGPMRKLTYIAAAGLAAGASLLAAIPKRV